MVEVKINWTLCIGEVFLLGCFPKETSPTRGVRFLGLGFVKMFTYFLRLP